VFITITARIILLSLHYVNFKIKAHVKKKKQLLHVKITKEQQRIRTPTTKRVELRNENIKSTEKDK